MNFNELVKKVNNEMLDVLFNNRKDIYSIFEYDYLHKMNNYIINRQYQSVYTFTDKETSKQYFIEFFTQKEDSQVMIKRINSGIYN